MFRCYSDHLQGAHMFLVKFLTFLTNFKISNFNKEHMSALKMI